MRRTFYLVFIFFTSVSFGVAQSAENVDFISDMHENRAAIKKGNQWAFINTEGQIVINYRDDLVVSNNKSGNYPIFKNGRCIITQKKDGISYFGYIDVSGKTVIEPQYLNASNFQNDMAIVLLLTRTEIAKNTALDKPVVSYDYFEVVIDLTGQVLTYLTLDPIHITLSPEYLRKPPIIHSKFINNKLFAVTNKEKKWSVVKVE